MIRHICMFALQDEDHDNVVAEALRLGEPLKTLPQAVKGEVVTNSPLAPSSNYDICLVFDFETMADLDAYQVDPIHVAFKNYVVAHMKSRACIDCEI